MYFGLNKMDIPSNRVSLFIMKAKLFLTGTRVKCDALKGKSVPIDRQCKIEEVKFKFRKSVHQVLRQYKFGIIKSWFTLTIIFISSQ